LDDREAHYNNRFGQNLHRICDFKFYSINTLSYTDKGTYK